jgi:NTE family protein
MYQIPAQSMRIHIPPRRLLLSGGGIRVISYVGVLQVLEEKGFLKGIREFCGVSAGSLLALMLALGYKLSVLERFCFEYDFSNVRSFEPENILDFLETYGVDDGSNLEKLLQKILHHKGFKPNVTFEELEASGTVKSVRLWAADIQMLHPIEFSAKATPKMEVIFALRASMAIPMYFTPVRHPTTNTFLVDGGVFDNYPISYLTETEANETLGVAFEFSKRPVDVGHVGTFISLLSAGYYQPSYQRLIKQYMDRTICLPCAEQSALDFEASVEQRRQLVTIGRQAAETFFNTPPIRSLLRRHSVS